MSQRMTQRRVFSRASLPLALAATASAFGCSSEVPLAAALPTTARLAPALADLVDVGLSTAMVQNQIEEQDPSLVFWRRGGLELKAKDHDALRQLQILGLRDDLVMVTLPADSPLTRELAGDPRTLAMLPAGDGESDGEGTDDVAGNDADGTESQHVYAIVAAKDPLILHGLAAAAHGAAGHACGQLERLSFRAESSVPTLTPPLYLESVRLQAVATLTEAPSADAISTSISTLEALGTRYEASATGAMAPTKVKELFEAAAGSLPGFSVKLVDHIGTSQKSVVVTLAGTEDPETTVVLGSHLDSINSLGAAEAAPGADDDASGVATLVEVVRVLASQGARFQRTVELHAYAAEEVGLVGSQEIAGAYQDAGKRVAAMLQLDMTAYAASGGTTIHLVTNDTSATLRRSAKDLLNTYLDGDFTELSLGGGTSDHRSWSRAGYPAVFPFEHPNAYNHALHTADDTSATINNLPLAARLASLTLAFASHHAGLEAARAQYATLEPDAGDDLSHDLQLAILANAKLGGFDVAVAASDAVARIELCLISEAGSPLCAGARVMTQVARAGEGRTFFTPDAPLELGAESRLAVFGYDDADTLTAQRTVRLGAKP